MDNNSPAKDRSSSRELAVVSDETEEPVAAAPDKSTSDAQDSPPSSKAVVAKTSRLKAFFKHKITASIIGILLLLGTLALIPQTRYAIAGSFWKQNYTVMVRDSQTGKPVTKADISLDGQTSTTDNQGNATVRVAVGYHSLKITKKYYALTNQTVLVPVFVKNCVPYKLQATGRQVPVSVVNDINGQPVADADIMTSDAEAYTNGAGEANLVLSPNETTVSATITANGYNLKSTSVVLTTGNTFHLTPSGKIYFLSDLSGKIDVVKTNLDGTARQTVLAGTGYEDSNATQLLASRDWKYLMLDSIRTPGGNPQLNLIDTDNDKVVSIDNSDSTFGLVGWEGDDFVYTMAQNNYSDWMPGGSDLESYEAGSGKRLVLDTTDATGTSSSDAEFQSFMPGSVVEFASQIVYAKTWYQGTGYLTVPGKQNTLNSVNADGTGKKIITSLDAGNSYVGGLEIRTPSAVTVQVDSNNSTQASFYNYGLDGNFDLNSSAQATTLYEQPYPTYLLSPAADETFWSTPEDGKNDLYVGDQNGGSGKEIETSSNYAAYGWYTDNYLLVSQNGSELYIMPVAGGSALKVTDYHRVNGSYANYSAGYGGL
jgi:hypothetical protein